MWAFFPNLLLNPSGRVRSQKEEFKSQECSVAAASFLFLTMEARIYNGAKTASSINGAGKTGQLHVKE